MKNFIIQNAFYVIAPLAPIFLDFVLRKFPGATPLFQLLDNAFDKVPGFKNIEKKD